MAKYRFQRAISVNRKKRTIRIYVNIDFYVLEEIVAALIMFEDESLERPVTVIINSSSGFAINVIFIHNILKNSLVEVVTVIKGQAYSGAFIVFLAGSKRKMFKDSILIFHEAEDFSRDEFEKGDRGDAKFERLARENKIINNRLVEIVKSAVGNTLSKKQIRSLFNTRARLGAKQAVKMGLVHEIIEAE